MPALPPPPDSAVPHPAKPAKPASEAVRVVAHRRPPLAPKLTGSIAHTPETIDEVTQAAIKQQAATNVVDALRYAPGITLNSGEGGAHGDNINLRGFAAIDSFFLDGVRDPGAYTRDSFDVAGLDVLQGPASILFGNTPAGGAVNQNSKQPSLTNLRELGVETGTNAEGRGTLDVNQVLSDTAAVRLNAMGDTTGYAGRDYVQQRRWGVAPSLGLGLGTDTQAVLSYFHESENNIPDYGIPFLNGQPAPVSPSLYYGLKNSDTTRTDTNIGTARLQHDFDDAVSVSETLRYADYSSVYRVSAPHFGNDFVDPPAPNTPLNDIMVYRDRPSSEGDQTYLSSHTDVTLRFETGPLSHTLITGVELGRQTSNFARFDNEFEGVDGVAPTPLLAPNANEAAPAQNTIVSRPQSRADILGLYATDDIRITPQWRLDLGLRFDRYDTVFSDSVSDTSFHRVDTGVTPKVALVWQPAPWQTYYFAYTTSFDPAVSYLTLAPDNSGPPPQTAQDYELGAKYQLLHGALLATASLFRIDSANIVVSDPDDPTLQEMPGSNQRSQGVELTAVGHITDKIEINANYTLLDPRITASVTPGEVGRLIPNAARHTANIWLEYEPVETVELAAGTNIESRRFADSMNTAVVPGFATFNLMAGWQATPRLHFQLNLQNIADTKYFVGAYYSDATENHAIPGPGRTLTFGARIGF